MATQVEVEDIQTTKSEKLLAVVLAVFLLIGGLWTYEKIDDYVREAIETTRPTADERAAISGLENAERRLARARRAEREALTTLEVRREAYRTALEAGRETPALERRYRTAEARYEAAEAETRAAEREVEAARPPAREASRESRERLEQRLDRQELYIFLLRLVFVLASIAFSYWLLSRMRRRRSRYFPVALSAVGFAAVLAFVMAGDYISDYIDPLDLGPLVLSLLGTGLTLLAFVALQRYLARRLPSRRVRKRECPFCGYPVRQNEHCEGCGRAVVAACSTCSGPRRVGTLHCGTCGSA